MGNGPNHDILYPTQEEIFQIHTDIIEEDDDATEGVLNAGNVEFALETIEHGHFGEVPETIHEKAFTLMRYLAANHAFADGNKRTALNTTWTFYALNGYFFDYGEEIKAILKLLAVMERMVDQGEVIVYFDDITYTLDDERVPGAIIGLMHITKWYRDWTIRTKQFVREDLFPTKRQDDIDAADVEKVADRFSGLISEFKDLLDEMTEYREQYEESVPDEFIEHIEKLEEEWDTMEEVAEMIETTEDDELLEEKLDEVKDEHDLSADRLEKWANNEVEE